MKSKVVCDDGDVVKDEEGSVFLWRCLWGRKSYEKLGTESCFSPVRGGCWAALAQTTPFECVRNSAIQFTYTIKIIAYKWVSS